MTYPTLRRITNKYYESAEQRDGKPDFQFVYDKDTERWYVKWRTSAHWSGRTFATLQDAVADIRASLVAS